jgi:DASS family divalent anion:Na+ symporter
LTEGLNKKQAVSLLICILIGALFFVLPVPEGLSVAGWHVFGIFLATIVGLIIKPVPMGAAALIAVIFLVLTKSVTITDALSGFSNTTIWLIVMAFFISRGIIKTGLGERIAYLFVKKFGRKTINLAYALAFSDLLIAPAMLSNTARAGGILSPIVRSLSTAFGSDPKDGTEKKIGAYLTTTVFQCDMVTSAMFLTAMAANPLTVSIAKDVLGVNITWGSWFLAALVPGVLSLILIPMIIYRIDPPEIKETPKASGFAQKKLNDMGPLSKNEKYMIAVFILLVLLWIFGGQLGIDETLTAFIGLVILLLTGVLNWEDVKNEKGAWDTLIWFSVLVMMAQQLNATGMIPWFSTMISSAVSGMNWIAALCILAVIYFYSHYLFASGTAHVSAMYSAFISVIATAGAPSMMAALLLAYFSNLFGCLTHYGMGPAPVFFGSGYVSQSKWWQIGFILSIFHIIMWGVVGSLWWKLLGIW